MVDRKEGHDKVEAVRTAPGMPPAGLGPPPLQGRGMPRPCVGWRWPSRQPARAPEFPATENPPRQIRSGFFLTESGIYHLSLRLVLAGADSQPIRVGPWQRFLPLERFGRGSGRNVLRRDGTDCGHAPWFPAAPCRVVTTEPAWLHPANGPVRRRRFGKSPGKPTGARSWGGSPPGPLADRLTLRPFS
ncbi:MAG: hypothetical protein RL318_1905 [Fibrobacterota bacterium]|jgi:hypothetical protein